MKLLENKIALITGAGKGIGRALAEAYAGEGATVFCVSRTSSDLENVVDSIKIKGGQSFAIQADVTKFDEMAQLFNKVSQSFGRLDLLVANAGGNIEQSSVEEGSHEKWIKAIELNLFGAYFTIKNAIPLLKKSGAAKIITVGSGMGHRGIVNESSYCCAKTGLWMLTRILALELVNHHISVNELIPGPVNTLQTRDAADDPNSPFNIGSEWIKDPKDVIPLALFLATQPEIGPTAQSFSLMRRDV